MNGQKNNGKGIFYGVIGVATLVVAIIGATFAYFTATVSTPGNITGNMASISLALTVDKVTTTEDTMGLIPMSNGMIEAAVSKQGTNERGETKQVCVDDNGNAVCQIYKITMTNTSTAAVFVDGYVALKNSADGNAGVPTDVTAASITPGKSTTMRWAQVFPDNINTPTTYTTGLSDTGNGGSAYNLGGSTTLTWGSLDPASNVKNTQAGAQNIANIKNVFSDVVTTGGATINGNAYDNINKNYIRISDHTWQSAPETAETFGRTTDITSALVFNQRIAPTGQTGAAVTYYIAVWLTETGTNQNSELPGAQDTTKNVPVTDFFTGNVTFISANGSEVSGTFQGLTSYQH